MIEEKQQSNKTTKNLIYNYLEEGLYKKDAAVLSGIDESTFYRWIKVDASFACRVQISILKYKRSLITIVNNGAKENPKLALEILRSRWIDDDKEEQSKITVSNKVVADMLQEILASDD